MTSRQTRPIAYCLACLCACLHVTCSQKTETFTRETLETERPLGVVLVNWSYVSMTMYVTIFLLVVLLVGVILHHMHRFASILPETCILILIGVIIAGIVSLAKHSIRDKAFSNQVFMLYLLPPIVLSAAYGLNSRAFAANIGTVLLQAVLGTLINFAIIGPALYGFNQAGAFGSPEFMGFPLSLKDCFMFAAIIVAVDPVAVIAIFKEVGVNDTLYFLVFGESLLNDAVTVVLYDMMRNFITQHEIPGTQMAMGVAFFLVSSVGGAVLGLVFGLISAYVTKFTYKLPDAEPMILLLLAYMSYLLGQLFDWSSIIAITVCGITQAQFAFPNIAYESEMTAIKMIELLGSTLEAFVFLFLGGEIIENRHQWNVGFILITVALILIARFISIFGLTTIANIFGRKEKIPFKNMFIMWYGGLRGALAFVLCATLPFIGYAPRELFLTATIIVILFTVFVQGISMRLMVKVCGVEMKEKEALPIVCDVQDMVNDQMMCAVEIIGGLKYSDNYRRVQAYQKLDKTKQLLSKYHCTYATMLIVDMESRAFEKMCEIREEQYYQPCACCLICQKFCDPHERSRANSITPQNTLELEVIAISQATQQQSQQLEKQKQ